MTPLAALVIATNCVNMRLNSYFRVVISQQLLNRVGLFFSFDPHNNMGIGYGDYYVRQDIIIFNSVIEIAVNSSLDE